MDLTIIPGKPLAGEIHLPGDKSISHRAALLSALATGESEIGNFLIAGVTRPLLDALSSLGVPWSLAGNRLSVRGVGMAGFQSPPGPLECGNSATVLRLLAGALSAAGVAAVLDGSAGLRRRPMKRIVEPLALMGVPIQASAGDTAPLTLSPRLKSRPLRALNYRLPVASAQVKTCLLLAALAADGITVLTEPGPSRDHTERMLCAMGVEVHAEGDPALGDISVTLRPPASGDLVPLRIHIPGDFSSAAFLIVACLVTPGSQILLKNVGLNPTRTGLLDSLRAMGADIRISNLTEQGGEPAGDIFAASSPLHGISVDGSLVVRMIDEFPAFAVAAAFAQGETRVSGAAELRYKESDRISLLGQELRALGIDYDETPDGFVIWGGRPVKGGIVSAHGDHRLAMALAVAGLASTAPVTVKTAEIVAESFPEFPSMLRALGAEFQETGTTGPEAPQEGKSRV